MLAKLGEPETVRVAQDGHDQETGAVFALRVDRDAQMDAGLRALGDAAVAAERRDDRREVVRGARDRERDQVRERDLLAASSLAQRGVELAAALLEPPHRQRPETGRRRDLEALFHVADEREGRPAQRRDLGIGGKRDQSRPLARRGRAVAAARLGGAPHVLAHDQAAGTAAADPAQIDLVALGEPARLVRSRSAGVRRRARAVRAGGRLSGLRGLGRRRL